MSKEISKQIAKTLNAKGVRLEPSHIRDIQKHITPVVREAMK